MLVAVTGFGSVWRGRFSSNELDPKRFARVDQKNEVLAIYKTARAHYAG